MVFLPVILTALWDFILVVEPPSTLPTAEVEFQCEEAREDHLPEVRVELGEAEAALGLADLVEVGAEEEGQVILAVMIAGRQRVPHVVRHRSLHAVVAHACRKPIIVAMTTMRRPNKA